MHQSFATARNSILQAGYKYLIKPLLFQLDPELVHDTTVFIGNNLGKNPVSRKLTSTLFNYQNPMLEQTIFGIKFKNPVGLAAGFDKDANLTAILPEVGFGFEEVGSITAKPYQGNPKPRLTRLKNSKSIVVNYGLKSKGAKIISQKLKNKQFKYPIGISIAKTNCLETVDEEKGVDDYIESLEQFTDIGSYITLNISCPNTFGGQPFHEPRTLNKLLKRVDELNISKPVFIKISPDLSIKEVDAIIRVVENHRVFGFIMGNLTKDRTNSKIKEINLPLKGGLSGKVVEQLSNKLIKHLYQKTKGKYLIIGCGGIFTAEDAYKKIKLGASLVQLITGMVYQGPQTVSSINLGLERLLKKDGYKNISEAIGADLRN